MNFITTYESLRELELEVEENVVVFPEQKLLAAVVLTLIEDYEQCLKKLSSTDRAPIYLKWRLEALNHEVCSPHFEMLCDYTGVDAFHIRNKLKQFDKKYPYCITEWVSIECGPEYHERKSRVTNLPPR